MDVLVDESHGLSPLPSPPSRRVLPIGLLAEGRACLVVGGGKVAERKVHVLLEGGAEVCVVSPDLTGDLRALAATGTIRHVERCFEPEDPKGLLAVFAATNNKAVNREVLDACRKAGVLCCPVDGNWVQGDFVTPAVLRRGDLTVSISTGGRSCRKSRMLREDLERHMELVETAELVVLGTSHDYLAIGQREPLHLAGDRMAQTGAMLARVWGIHEFMLLNTCNRIEFVGLVSNPDDVMPLIRRILHFDTLKPDAFYLRRAGEAFEHMAVLTAGLLSQMPGECHIVGQVKDALEDATQRQWAGPLIREWVASMLHVSKEIRGLTSPLLRNIEIEDLCVEFLQSECPSLAGKRVVVIGAGIVGRGLIERLLPQLSRMDWIYHAQCPDLPDGSDDRVSLGTFNQLRDRLAQADIVISAAASPGHILHQGHAPFFDQEKSVLMVDLAIPRNIAPELNGITSNLRVVDMDDLKAWSRRRSVDLVRVYELSREVVKEHAELYERLVNSFQNGNSRQ